MDIKELRNLLLDCRTTLRRADAAFAGTPLSSQLDDTIIALGQGDAQPDLPEPETRTAQQVAYAWQSAARELRFTHPELHEKLSARVLRLLDTDVLLDADDEIQRLQQRVDEADARQREAQEELAGLRQTLADAVPGIDGRMPAAELARLRLRQLVEAARSGGAGLPRAAAPAPDSGGVTRAQLEAVAAGTRALTPAERDWCLGEAMVLTGFQRTPLQLLEDGEAALARLILQAPAPA